MNTGPRLAAGGREDPFELDRVLLGVADDEPLGHARDGHLPTARMQPRAAAIGVATKGTAALVAADGTQLAHLEITDDVLGGGGGFAD